MKKNIVFFLGAFLFASIAIADYRDFPYTYQARTLPQKELEFEYYIDSALPDFDLQSNYSWRQQFEIEYGVTDKFSLALYQSWRTQPFIDGTNATEYRTTFDSLKFLGKYRLSEPGEWFIDPLLYVEYVMSTSFVGKADKIEVKEVFSKDIDELHLAVNFTEEYAFENEWEVAYDAAAGFDVRPGKIYLSKCSACHHIRKIENYSYETWKEKVDEHDKRIKLSDNERMPIIELNFYLLYQIKQ